MATMMDMDKNRKPIVRTTAKEESDRMAKEAEADREAKAANLKSQKQAYSDLKTGKSFDLTKQGLDIARSVGKTEKPQSFKEAFAEARDAGKANFTWNGKKYTTEMAKKSSPMRDTARETSDYGFGVTNPDEFGGSEADMSAAHDEGTRFKKGGCVKMAKGGTASSRADGCAQRGKTKGKVV
jgi:hypothetical protein